MSDDLVYRIFVELAVLEKKRDVDGNWLTMESQEVSRLLKKAFSFVARAETEGPARQMKPAGG
ncbi:MAG: hypothetical protein H0X27_02655 [Caulobacteraceae bacterium]|nr:hypothetical protein [Caulobacteraceae bacterium]